MRERRATEDTVGALLDARPAEPWNSGPRIPAGRGPLDVDLPMERSTQIMVEIWPDGRHRSLGSTDLLVLGIVVYEIRRQSEAYKRFIYKKWRWLCAP